VCNALISSRALFCDDRTIRGEVSKETDALSRSVAAQLETLKHGVATSAGSEGIAAVAQAKILTTAQNRQLKAELGARISALEMRVEQCEQTAVGRGCCWISVHDTAVEVFESEVTPDAAHLPGYSRR
jgi:hypothetical protein